jgi:chitin disaccharide deacetylase
LPGKTPAKIDAPGDEQLTTSPHIRHTNRLLGYPDDARLLIINADDFAMCHAVNEAIMHSLREGVVRSTSLMVPFPWSHHGMQLLRENPDISFGVHLTVIRDTVNYNWSPLSDRAKIPSLLDATGYFYDVHHMDDFAAHADLDEVELEFRAQIDTVLAADLKPAHLDWHCLHSGGRADIFSMTLRLAREYKLALRVANHPYIEQVQARGLPTDDYDLLDSYDLDTNGKSAVYAQLLRDLPVGLSEWAVHPGTGQGELQAIEPDSWQVRQTDYDFVMSPEAKDIIKAEGIILLDYRALQTVWNNIATG